MKFTVNSALLSQRLQTLGRVISSKNSIPILGTFFFKLKDGVLSVMASDNEIVLTTVLDLVASEGEMEFTINAKTAQDSIREIPEQPLEFCVNDDTLEITVYYQNGSYSMMAESSDQYPLPKPMDDQATTLVLPNTVLYNGVNRALFAAGNDPLRPVMSGVYFDQRADGLCIVASDGRKLASTRMPQIVSETECSLNLPQKAASIFKNYLVKESGDTTIRFTNREAELTTEHYTMTCRLIEGRFPNYNSVIPRNNPNAMTVSRSALLAALRRIMVFSNAGSPLVKFRIESGRLEVSTRDIDYRRSGVESLLCEFNNGSMEIGFKGPLLMELLSNMDHDEVVFKMSDPSRASIVVPAEQQEDEEVVMLIMPMMISE